MKAIIAEASLLNDVGDISSEDAKQMVRRLRSLTGKAKRPNEAQVDVIRDAYTSMISDAEARSEILPFDAATLDFIRQVTKKMKESGELT
jgi:hypothetical protein